MKKKLFLGALLLGALTLNSCVDNVESDSVKSIRQAKAEQLKAKAEYDKAQGEAALIAAQAAQKAQEIAAAAQAADAEYKKAQAEYQRAQAAYWEAQAAYYNAQAESEKAAAAQKAEQAAVDLETKKVELEEKKAKLENYKKELASLDAKYEQELYYWQLQALNAQRALEKAIANGDQTKYNDLLTLLTQYNNAVNALSTAQKSLVEQKISIAKYEAGITNGNDYLEWQIETKKDQIKTLQDQNEAWQAAIDTYETEQSYESAKADLEKVTKEIADLNITLDKQAVETTGATTKAANAKYNLDASDYVQAAKKVAALGSNIYTQDFTSAGTTYTKTLSVSSYSSTYTNPEAAGYVCAVIYDPSTSQSTYYRLFSDIDSEIKYLYYEEYQNTTQQSKRYTYYNEYYTLYKDGAGMDELIAAANDFVKNNQQKKYDDAAKAYDVQADTVKSVQKFYDTLVPLKEAYDDAVKALNDDTTGDPDGTLAQAVTDAGDKFKEALEGKTSVGANPTTDYEVMLPTTITATAIARIVTALESQLNTEKIDLNTTKLNTKNSTLNLLNTAKDEVADIEDYAKTLKAGNAANNEAVKAVNDANLAKAKAELAQEETTLEIKIKSEIRTALNNIVNNNNVESTGYQVESLKALIKANETTIGQYEAELAQFEKQAANNDFNNEELIEKAKIEVAELENKIALLEERVKLAKELLDAAMKAE